MTQYLRKIDTKTTGRRYDVTPLFADPQAFGELVEDLVAPFLNTPLDRVACIDALGFILGTAIARRLNVGIVPVRKGDKLPVEAIGEEFRDYSGTLKRLEVRKDAFSSGTRVLLVDEWIETGAQIRAAAKLIESQGAIVVGIASINMDSNETTNEIRSKYKIQTAHENSA